MADSILTVSDLSCEAGGKTVLHGLNVRIERHAVTAVIGPNGCGKSTLLGCMCRLRQPSAGEITLNGRSIRTYKRKELARKMAILTQQDEFPDRITVQELVEAGRFAHKSFLRSDDRSGKAAVKDAMEITRTSEFSQRQAHTLSGGERQRVRMAMALAQEPQLLLLDEPGTYLDIRHQLEIMDLLVKLKRERQMTIVIVLHDINQAALYADYTIAMKAGRIQAYGKTDEVITRQLVEQVFDLNVNEFVSSNGETVLMPSGNK